MQISLLHAAVKAGCRRFAPSQWGTGIKAYEALSSLRMVNEGVWTECLKYEDKIELGRLNNGLFMNYFAYGIYNDDGTVETDETKLRKLREGGGYAAGLDTASEGITSYGDLKDGSGSFLLSLSKGIAELPIKADGQWPQFSTTTLRDVGPFVVASLELPKWEHDMSMAGDTITMAELLRIAEKLLARHLRLKN
ncbi:hypothetical protein QQX98_007150 [Neonectria punicea]|uniref:NmrA-like domain-containing protein n=1 Tax=Neonectria punicea TaxID=979145 RepID=A0ABR1GYR7_9HYPO